MPIKHKKFRFLTKNRRLPNGCLMRLDFIDHPGAALMVPFLNPKTVILLRQYRAAIKGYLYELPAGTLEKKESPLSCARRELVEETGYRARKWKKLGKIFPVPGYSNEIIYLYEARDLSEAYAQQDVDEVIEVVPVTRSKLKQMFRKGQITDAKTICALTFAGLL